jgi:hypothetical protein
MVYLHSIGFPLILSQLHRSDVRFRFYIYGSLFDDASHVMAQNSPFPIQFSALLLLQFISLCLLYIFVLVFIGIYIPVTSPLRFMTLTYLPFLSRPLFCSFISVDFSSSTLLPLYLALCWFHLFVSSVTSAALSLITASVHFRYYRSCTHTAPSGASPSSAPPAHRHYPIKRL